MAQGNAMKVALAFAAVMAIGAAILFSLMLNRPGPQARGQALYAANCASCHGANLEGQANWRVPNADGSFPAPPHNVDGHTWHHDDGLLLNYTKVGGQQAMEALGVTDFKSAMPAFGDQLTDAEIDDIWIYIKSTWPDRARKAQADRTAAQKDADS